jgi:ABC-type branched-subunit amino acid transport system substrate-binding protein
LGASLRRRRGRHRAVALVAALALVSACGSRANDAQIAEALGTGAGRGAGNGTAAAKASSGANGAAAGTPGAGAGAAGAAADPAAATGDAGAAGPAPGDTGPGSTLPPEGNGGATDVGVTGDTITLGNVSILTGPVPGLFAGAVNGVDAFLAYQNSQGGVFGRQLKLAPADDQFNCGTNKTLTEDNISKVFAFVGSFSLFDNCGAEVLAAHPEVPDIHNALSHDAQVLPNNFPPQAIRKGSSLGPFQYIKDKAPDAITKSASLVGDVQSAKDSWDGIRAAMESLGYQFPYVRTYTPTETDFTADIVRMRSAGIELLVLVAADVKTIARVQAAAARQGWKPKITLVGASGYDATLVPLAGADSLEGVYLYLPTAMYLGEDNETVPEVGLFNEWLSKTHPDAKPDLFSVYGWTSARLFTQALEAAGPQATRAGLISALQQITSFNSNGLLATSNPAGKGPPTCYIMVQVSGGEFHRVDDPPNDYRCDSQYFELGG